MSASDYFDPRAAAILFQELVDGQNLFGGRTHRTLLLPEHSTTLKNFTAIPFAGCKIIPRDR
jgi:hypothetical protein